MAEPTTGSSTPEDMIPPEIPDFELIRCIGEGGFGQVWLAANRATKHLRAVKVIPLQSAGRSDPAGREITSLTSLEAHVRRRHANLMVIHHVAQTDQHLFYVMDPADDISGGPASEGSEYCPATLEGKLKAGPLEPDACWRCAEELLAGLACLHEAGIVHRDVKPSNCLFVEEVVKLADFGLVTKTDREISRVGTWKYMPPDGQMDARADVYAAGLVIYEMMTGRPAGRFPRLSKNASLVVGDPTLRVLNRLSLRACQRDPEKRFPNAKAMLAEMRASAPQLVARRKRARRRALAAIGGSVVFLGLGGIAWWATRPPLVRVNFVTEPFEATIYLDDELLEDSEGIPYRTPCTIPDIPAQIHHVVFKHDERGELDADRIDFAKNRLISARWSPDS
ncbi:MAG: serine/threonine protein kinase [Planctomycetes bacterium]|nr:serine/threonine protein kinase [Planctomycetota bacterium]